MFQTALAANWLWVGCCWCFWRSIPAYARSPTRLLWVTCLWTGCASAQHSCLWTGHSDFRFLCWWTCHWTGSHCFCSPMWSCWKSSFQHPHALTSSNFRWRKRPWGSLRFVCAQNNDFTCCHYRHFRVRSILEKSSLQGQVRSPLFLNMWDQLIHSHGKPHVPAKGMHVNIWPLLLDSGPEKGCVFPFLDISFAAELRFSSVTSWVLSSGHCLHVIGCGACVCNWQQTMHPSLELQSFDFLIFGQACLRRTLTAVFFSTLGTPEMSFSCKQTKKQHLTYHPVSYTFLFFFSILFVALLEDFHTDS